MRERHFRGVWWRRTWLGMSLVAALWVMVAQALAGGEPTPILTRSVPLNPEDPDMDALGALRWCGSLELTSPKPTFGELSDLVSTDSGSRLHFIADNGFWYTAKPQFDPQGRLVGLGDGEVGRLRGLAGQPLAAGLESDAEGLAKLTDGSMLVAFERLHRILRYPPGERPLSGEPVLFSRPPELDQVPGNQGIEAMVGLLDGRILILLESPIGDEIRGFLWTMDRWRAIRIAGSGAYRPTSMSALPAGDLLFTERRYAPTTGVSVRVRRIALADIRPGATLSATEIATFQPPLSYDNIEGLAVQATLEAGWVRILLVSDDNLNPAQRTLLLCFLYQE